MTTQRSHARRRRLLVYVNDLALLGLLAAAVWSIHRWSWWAVPFAVLVVGLAGKRLIDLRPRLVSASQRAQSEWLLESAARDPRAPILLLRSFASGTSVEPSPTIRAFGREQPLNSEASPAAAKSFVLQAASALRKLGPIVAIGFSRRGHTATPILDVLYLYPSDKVWFELFELLSASCRAVIMIPGETPSVVREYLSLRSRRLDGKLLMVMPPQPLSTRWIPWVVDHHQDLEAAWKATAARFAAEGIQLPPYNPRGLAFIIDDGGGVTQTVSLEGHILRLDRAIESLIPAPAGTTSMRELVSKLAPYTRPELT